MDEHNKIQLINAKENLNYTITSGQKTYEKT